MDTYIMNLITLLAIVGGMFAFYLFVVRDQLYTAAGCWVLAVGFFALDAWFVYRIVAAISAGGRVNPMLWTMAVVLPFVVAVMHVGKGWNYLRR